MHYAFLREKRVLFGLCSLGFLRGVHSFSKLLIMSSTFAKLYKGRAGELEHALLIEVSYRRLAYEIYALETKSETVPYKAW